MSITFNIVCCQVCQIPLSLLTVPINLELAKQGISVCQNCEQIYFLTNQPKSE